MKSHVREIFRRGTILYRSPAIKDISLLYEAKSISKAILNLEVDLTKTGSYLAFNPIRINENVVDLDLPQDPRLTGNLKLQSNNIKEFLKIGKSNQENINKFEIHFVNKAKSFFSVKPAGNIFLSILILEEDSTISQTNKTFCMHCGRIREGEGAFCTFCGNRPYFSGGADLISCTKCQNFNPPQVRFCSQCGEEYKNVVVKPVVNNDTVKCTFCNNLLEAKDIFCSQCGSKMK